MTPGDDERNEAPSDTQVAAAEPAPSSGLVMDATTPPTDGRRLDEEPQASDADAQAPAADAHATDTDGVPPELGASSVDTNDDQRDAGTDVIPPPVADTDFAEAAKGDDETVEESVAHAPVDLSNDAPAVEDKAEEAPRRVTSLVDDDESSDEVPVLDGDSDAKPKAKRRRKKAEEPAGLPKVDDSLMEWYVLKVQSNREDSIADAIKRRLKIAAVDPHVGEVIVPTEKVLEIKDGKKRVVKRKFYPGYIMLRMELTDDVWFVIRDTPGVGHFLGPAEKPLPMTAQDVERMLGRTASAETESAVKDAAPRPAIEFAKGDRVVIKEGPFENFEGDVEEVNEDKGTVRVMIQIFGRPTPVDVKYWEVGKVRM